MSAKGQEKEALEILRKYKKGATVRVLQQEVPSWESADIVNIMNKLAEKRLVEFITLNGNLAFKSRDLAELNKTADLGITERVIYNYVREAGSKAIWHRELRNKSQLSLTAVNAVLKTLEKKMLVKKITPVKGSKKMYMLYDLEPSAALTGGAWFTGGEFDSGFVDALCIQCYKYIFAKSIPKEKGTIFPSGYNLYPSLSDIYNYLKTSGITQVELTKADVEELVNRLIYDGKITRRLKISSDDSSDEEFSQSEEEYMRPKKRPKKATRDSDAVILGTVDEWEKEKREEEDDEDADKTLGGFIVMDEEEKKKKRKRKIKERWMYIAVKETNERKVCGATMNPCGVCPVFDFCNDDGPISPVSCIYYKEWLDDW